MTTLPAAACLADRNPSTLVFLDDMEFRLHHLVDHLQVSAAAIVAGVRNELVLFRFEMFGDRLASGRPLLLLGRLGSVRTFRRLWAALEPLLRVVIQRYGRLGWRRDVLLLCSRRLLPLFAQSDREQLRRTLVASRDELGETADLLGQSIDSSIRL